MTAAADALRTPDAYPHCVKDITVVETHISLVFLTGEYAYKLKKPVNLGFLDFSTLERRRRFCRKELELNRRLCRELYLDVLPVTEDAGRVAIGGKGKIIDYVVKMKQFDRELELDRLLDSGKLTRQHIDEISELVASFHLQLPPAGTETPYGSPERILKTVLNNFLQTAPLAVSAHENDRLGKLRTWTEQEHHRLEAQFIHRKNSGCIRQCHGDMHTGNMVIFNGRICIFDGIEFNPELSFIDLMSEVAFFVMDLVHRHHPEFAWRFLNDYLAATGDYEGIQLLRFYAVYRAMVRAKVTAIRYSQETLERERTDTREEHLSFLAVAERFAARQQPLLIMTTGVSGSGKTTLAREISSRLPALHCRSDIERKRLFGLDALAHTAPRDKHRIYGEEAGRKTYNRLLEVAESCLAAGYHVILDATYLKQSNRLEGIALAERVGAQPLILDCNASVGILQSRVEHRLSEGRDPSEANPDILREQLKNRDPLSDEEKKIAVTIDTGAEDALSRSLARLAPYLEKR
ncbi:AAA family ATPase [Prosthecochloris sp. N3]|uniref:AAA family ATPase n=1 Tax=Prosthecochloris ethylica TaxID=2743976 RepID=A0ABR9XP81_9CHLB|nr:MULTISPECIES: bifunctional aminoglycoside phosphotransferase/ATP-binding protein [Prosthecochloris]MBF0586130.1 AAA family ATPase [Prosthecochloris ethylica]MBF0635836.1 AAA family ATPase [Prosthecochloris ethylica]NUK47488.1 AAA family ATPase [Prosthecochloris ethylica]RNA65033.1 hypothetical protein CR163_007200 [Prosthecochloris sp. ZM_2]